MGRDGEVMYTKEEGQFIPLAVRLFYQSLYSHRAGFDPFIVMK